MSKLDYSVTGSRAGDFRGNSRVSANPMNIERIPGDIRRFESILVRNNSLTSATELARWKQARNQISRLRKRVEVEERFRTFTNQSAALQWAGPKDFLRALHVLWWHLQEDLYCNYATPKDLSLCSRDCKILNELVCLNEEMQLYGCCLHGSLHECSPRFATDPETKRVVTLDPNCACKIRSKADDIVCMFSGRVAARALSNMRNSSRDFQSDSASVRGQASYSYAMAAREAHSNRFENTDAVKPASRPRDEQITESAARPMASRKRGYADETTFSPEGYRAERVQNEVLNERRTYLLGHAVSVVQRVLYDKERRRKINEHREVQMQEACEKSLFSYHATHTGDTELPSFIQCVVEFWGPLADFRLLPYAEIDYHELQRIGERILRLWEICHRSPYAQAAPKKDVAPMSKRYHFCTLSQFTLAVLYSMREGLYISSGARGNMRNSLYKDRIQFVPFRPYMALELPHEKDLEMFSDSATQALAEVATGMKSHGTAEVQRKKRAKKQRRRPEHRNRRVEVDFDKTVSEACMLPVHWKNLFLGKGLEYCVNDVNRGRKFLASALNSYDVEFLHTAAQTLDWM